MNSIDANGVGIYRTPKPAYGSHRYSPTCRRATMDSMSTLIRTVVPAAALTARQRQAWQRVAIMTPLTPENT